MLGEMIGEDKGKITMKRVLRGEASEMKMEVTIQTAGKLLGFDYHNIGSYWSMMKGGGHLYGEGQGFIVTNDGEHLRWVGQGVGRFTQAGGLSWRGALYFETASAKLAKLNGMAVLFEHESDAQDNVTTKYWEWK